MLGHKKEIKKALPKVSIPDIEDLPNLALAVAFAARQVNRTPQATELAKLGPRGAQLRRRILATAVALAETGLLPDHEVSAIRAGSGKIDNATDLVRLAALFRQYAKQITNKHSITDVEIKEAAELGTRMLEILKPQGTAKSTAVSPELAAKLDVRDRFFTLLVRRYSDHLWRAGAWLFRAEIDKFVPPLMSRRPARTKKLPSARSAHAAAPAP